MTRDGAGLIFRDVDADPPERGRRWVATFPGELVSVHDIDIPPAIRGAERLKAAEIMLSDRVADDPGNLTILPLPARPRARVWDRVAVADSAALNAVRGSCAGGCLALLPDFLALPFADRCAVLESGPSGLCRLRVGADFGCTAEPAILAEVLEILAADGALDGIHICPGVPPDLAAEAEALGLAPVEAAALTLPDEALVRAQDMGAASAASGQRLAPWLRRNWTPIAALYAALILTGSGLVLRAQDQEAAAAALRAEATELARDRFLPTGPILDLRRQVSRALDMAERSGADGRTTDFVSELARLSTRLAAETGGVQRIAWGAREGYVIELTVASFAELQSLAGDLGTAGYDVDIASSRVLGADGVGATLRLSPQETGQ